MSESEPTSPRARLQALLAIPDRQRTEAQWDELNELEIMLAAGNREGAPEQGVRRNSPAPGGPPGGRPNPRGGPRGKKPDRKFHRRDPKR